MNDTTPVEVRREQRGDETVIAHVNREAFGQPDESRLIDALRKAGHTALSLVAVARGRIVGHILFTPVTIDSPERTVSAVGLGPMAVLPQFQRQGIGSLLVEAGLRECAGTGRQIVVVVGHPEFYPRFGFRPGRAFGLRCQFEVPDDVFMVAELTAGALGGHGGLVRYLPEFGGS
jgi:putative acetyltransferase